MSGYKKTKTSLALYAINKTDRQMLFTELQPWIYTILFGLMAALIIGNNLWHFILCGIRGESASFTLIIGAVLGVIALLVAPAPYLKWYTAVPILIDPGTGFSIYLAIKKKPPNND